MGAEELGKSFVRGELRKLFHRKHDSDRIYLEMLQVTILSLEISNKLIIGGD